MEKKAIEITLKEDRSIRATVLPGHFATNHSHVNYYVDLTAIKSRQRVAKRAAAKLAERFQMSGVNTIICLEGTEMVGAFLGQELNASINTALDSDLDICVLTPELNSNNQMIFRDNTRGMVEGKRLLLLISTVSTGKTLRRMADCLDYYGGVLAGVAALFSVVHHFDGVDVHGLFTERELPDYRSYLAGSCDICASGRKVDAIANSYGYAMLNQ